MFYNIFRAIMVIFVVDLKIGFKQNTNQALLTNILSMRGKLLNKKEYDNERK